MRLPWHLTPLRAAAGACFLAAGGATVLHHDEASNLFILAGTLFLVVPDPVPAQVSRVVMKELSAAITATGSLTARVIRADGTIGKLLRLDNPDPERGLDNGSLA